jgi:CheY-like chemotaxis protein
VSPEKESQTGASRVRFEVRDTGCGLKTNDPAKLFSRYSPGGPGRSPQGSPQGTPAGTTPETSNVTTPEGTPHQTPTEGSIEEARKELEDKLSFSAKKATGLGIGLNLTYGLVRAMGGELRADSKPGNTTFWFVLPAGDAHTPAPDERYVATGDQLGPAVPVPDNVGWARGDRMERKSRRKANWNSISRYGEDSSAGEVGGSTTSDSDSTPFPGSSPVMQPRKWEEEAPVKKLVQASEVAGRGLSALDAPHVLVVEDTDMCAMIVCMLLKKLGCSTDHAENGAEALEMLKNAEPGLYSMVLMDLRMPVMDGFEATTAIKEMGLPLPVVALTADEGFDTRDRCFAIGFDDFATKPLHHEELAALIQKHTGHCVCAAPAPSAQAPVATPVLA